MRAGRTEQQATGYRAFVPTPLPPEPPLRFDGELTRLLSEADRALGRLDGVASILPNPDLFVAMYVRHEAVLSSQIEGTQSTLEDILDFEADSSAEHPRDLAEVVNYVAAMNHGLARLPELPVCTRLLKEVHEKLMSGVRGSERNPGEVRTTQNWICPAGCTLATATFVPPPPHQVLPSLSALERFLNPPTVGDGEAPAAQLPVLVQAGLAHAQFETIHPFLDGNGRVGRLLITLLLVERGVLQRPLLYLSHYLKKHRAAYYDRLSALRLDGDWEGWLAFFLRGVAEVSQSATETAKKILELRETSRARLAENANAVRLLDVLFRHPIITVRMAERDLDVAYVTAQRAVDAVVEAGLLREATGNRRNRKFHFEPYITLFGSP